MSAMWAVLAGVLLVGASSAEAQPPASIELSNIRVRAVARHESAPPEVEARVGTVRSALEDCVAHGGSVEARWEPEAVDVAIVTVDGSVPRAERRCVLAVLAELDLVPIAGTAGFHVTLDFLETSSFEGEVVDLTGLEDVDAPPCGIVASYRTAAVEVDVVLEGDVGASPVPVPVLACDQSYRRHRRALVGHPVRVTLRRGGRVRLPDAELELLD